MAIVEEQYWVNLQGKRHPTYPGVLLAAREEGLLGLEVTILQYPSPENGETCVCSALVTMQGVDGRNYVFQDVGDASPKNVNSRIALHIIRMASTRAKGRALRDAIGLGVALVEEMGGTDANESDTVSAGLSAPGAVREPGSRTNGSPPAPAKPAVAATPRSVGQSPPSGRPPTGPVVGAESGSASCELCGKPLTNSQRLISEKHFGGRHLCPTDQRNERVALGTRAQSAHAPA